MAEPLTPEPEGESAKDFLRYALNSWLAKRRPPGVGPQSPGEVLRSGKPPAQTEMLRAMGQVPEDAGWAERMAYGIAGGIRADSSDPAMENFIRGLYDKKDPDQWEALSARRQYPAGQRRPGDGFKTADDGYRAYFKAQEQAQQKKRK